MRGKVLVCILAAVFLLAGGAMASEVAVEVNGAALAEPGIVEAVQAFQPTQAKNRNPQETLNDIRVIFTDIADMMQAIGTQLDDEQRYIQSKIDEYIYYLRKEADYRLARM